jgi:stage II sporulation protein D
MSTQPSIGPVTRSAPPSAELRRAAALGLVAAALLAACAPPPPAVPRPGPAPVAPGLPRAEPDLRVGLLVDTARAEVGSSGGFEAVQLQSRRSLGRAAAGARWSFEAAPGGGVRYRIDPGGEWRTSGESVLLQPRGGSVLAIGDASYRGALLVQPAAAGRLSVVNLVPMERYLLGVVPREIGLSRVPPELREAVKAQAIAARTYAIAHRGRREALGFDIYATVQDQVYGGMAAESEDVTRAVLETAGEILVFDGRPIEAYYHSTCAGRTAAIHEVWNSPPIPYLVSVVDVDPATGEAYDRTSNRFRWTTRWPAAQLESILQRTLADSLPAGVSSVGQIRDMRVLERTTSGRVAALRIETSTARFVVGRDRVRWILPTPQGAPLNSSKFDVQLVRDAAGRVTEVVAEGGGWGHGIGMCQVGAMGRSRAGQDYRTILRAYYPGSDLVSLY